MDNARTEAAWRERDASRLGPIVAGAVCVLVFVYYWALLTDGRFLHIEPLKYGLVFNSMIEHLARGTFDVDASIIEKEGFTRDGHTYAYFGVMPAMLRWPILFLPRYRNVDFTAISCAIAATIAALAKLAMVVRAARVRADLPLNHYFPALLGLVTVFAGSQVQFLRPSVYQESIFWAMACAALFIMIAFGWCVDIAGRRPAHLMCMAVLAGLCLNTRVSTSLGLYAACGGLLLLQIRAIFQQSGRARVRTALASVVLPSLVLAAFILMCSYVNYQRWGNPLTFQDYRYYNTITPDDPVHEIIRRSGYFSFARIPFALSYYFLPIWAIIRPDGQFLFHETRERLFFLVEPPPTSFLLSDLFLLALSALGILFLCRRQMHGVDGLAARITAVALLIPGGLMLMAIAVSFRYRMEFYPGFEFLAVFGLIGLAGRAGSRVRLLAGAGLVAAGISVAAAHAGLLAYKVTPWGDYLPVEKIGWVASYKNYLGVTYPQLGRLIGGL